MAKYSFCMGPCMGIFWDFFVDKKMGTFSKKLQKFFLTSFLMHILELQQFWSISKNSPLSSICNIHEYGKNGGFVHMIDLVFGAFPSMVNMICDLTGWVAVSGSEKNATEVTAHQGSCMAREPGKRETLETLSGQKRRN